MLLVALLPFLALIGRVCAAELASKEDALQQHLDAPPESQYLPAELTTKKSEDTKKDLDQRILDEEETVKLLELKIGALSTSQQDSEERKNLQTELEKHKKEIKKLQDQKSQQAQQREDPPPNTSTTPDEKAKNLDQNIAKTKLAVEQPEDNSEDSEKLPESENIQEELKGEKEKLENPEKQRVEPTSQLAGPRVGDLFAPPAETGSDAKVKDLEAEIFQKQEKVDDPKTSIENPGDSEEVPVLQKELGTHEKELAELKKQKAALVPQPIIPPLKDSSLNAETGGKDSSMGQTQLDGTILEQLNEHNFQSKQAAPIPENFTPEDDATESVVTNKAHQENLNAPQQDLNAPPKSAVLPDVQQLANTKPDAKVKELEAEILQKQEKVDDLKTRIENPGDSGKVPVLQKELGTHEKELAELKKQFEELVPSSTLTPQESSAINADLSGTDVSEGQVEMPSQRGDAPQLIAPAEVAPSQAITPSVIRNPQNDGLSGNAGIHSRVGTGSEGESGVTKDVPLIDKLDFSDKYGQSLQGYSRDGQGRLLWQGEPIKDNGKTPDENTGVPLDGGHVFQRPSPDGVPRPPAQGGSSGPGQPPKAAQGVSLRSDFGVDAPALKHQNSGSHPPNPEMFRPLQVSNHQQLPSPKSPKEGSNENTPNLELSVKKPEVHPSPELAKSNPVPIGLLLQAPTLLLEISLRSGLGDNAPALKHQKHVSPPTTPKALLQSEGTNPQNHPPPSFHLQPPKGGPDEKIHNFKPSQSNSDKPGSLGMPPENVKPRRSRSAVLTSPEKLDQVQVAPKPLALSPANTNKPEAVQPPHGPFALKAPLPPNPAANSPPDTSKLRSKAPQSNLQKQPTPKPIIKQTPKPIAKQTPKPIVKQTPKPIVKTPSPQILPPKPPAPAAKPPPPHKSITH